MAEQNNVVLTQKLYRLFNEGDIPEIMQHIDEDVYYHYHAPREVVSYGSGLKGHAELLHFFGLLNELYEFELFEPREFFGQGDKVVATGVERIKVRATGEVYDSDWVHVIQYKNGKLVRNDLFDNSALAARALGALNIAMAKRFIEEGWHQGDLAVTDELFDPNFIAHDPATLPNEQGAEGRKRSIQRYRAAFPDLQFTMSDYAASGDLVYYHYVATGTHQGELNGILPTGKKVSVTGTASQRYVNGKVVEDWSHWDALGLMQQLGVLP